MPKTLKTPSGRIGKIMKRERAYDGFFKVDRLTVEQSGPSGTSTYTREVFERGHAAAVLLYDRQSDQVLLVEELRAGPLAAGLPSAQCWSLGPVAGGIEMKDGMCPEEAAIQAALREVEEEAGFSITREDLRGPLSTMVSPGGTSEVIHHFIACVDLSSVAHGAVHGLVEENEEIVTHLMRREDARALVGAGIQNGLAITLLMMLESMVENGFKQNAVKNSTDLPKHLMDDAIEMEI